MKLTEKQNKIKILENVPIKDIKPYEKNYQKHDDNIEHIKNSIKDFDFDVPIVVDVNNVIVKGHGRYEALKQLGHKTIPYVAVNESLDTEKKASAARIADNESSKAAVIDEDLLEMEMDFIGDDFDLGDYGLVIGENESNLIEDENFDDKNQEIDINNFENKACLVLKFDNEIYLDLLQRLNALKVDNDTNEELFLKMLDNYESGF